MRRVGEITETVGGLNRNAWALSPKYAAHNETRSWHGWHRHVSLVMLAFALLMVIRHKADTSPQKRPPTEQHKLWSDGPSRRSVVLPGV
jgi:hypothetical protein